MSQDFIKLYFHTTFRPNWVFLRYPEEDAVGSKRCMKIKFYPEEDPVGSKRCMKIKLYENKVLS